MALGGRILGAVLLVGVGAVAIAALAAAPHILKTARPLLREGLKRGVKFYEGARASAAEFAAAHVPGTINVPLNMLVQWSGFFVDYDKPLHLIAAPTALSDVLKRLRSIGIDNICGSFDAGAVQAAAAPGWLRPWRERRRRQGPGLPRPWRCVDPSSAWLPTLDAKRPTAQKRSRRNRHQAPDASGQWTSSCPNRGSGGWS